jgi:hypothetical protein
MQYKSLFSYHKFGASCRYLQDASVGYPLDGSGGINANLDAFFASLDMLGLPVTKRVVQDELSQLRETLAEQVKEENLSAKQVTELTEGMRLVRTTLDAEIRGVGAYTPTQKRIDLTKLLENVPELFASNVFDTLPEIARYDLNEAGKCIAFERSTAAAFHILRATEDVLRFYYRTMVRQKRITNLN